MCFAYCYGLKQIVAHNVKLVEENTFMNCKVKLVTSNLKLKSNEVETVEKKEYFQEITADKFLERKKLRIVLLKSRNNCKKIGY